MKKLLKRKLHKGVVAAIGLTTLGTGSVHVSAQENDDAAFADLFEELIVTARRREESVQDVPFAITAFGKNQIEERAITELDDVARFTAGFSFEDFDGGNGSPVIRGQATINRTAREQTTAVFLDGVYLPRSWLTDLGTANIERIEIAKGPQSARYGRNAFAGAVNYVPIKAKDELEFNVTGTLGTDEREDIGLALSVPVVKDTLLLRASYDTSEFDGSWTNDHPNANSVSGRGTKGNAGGWDNETYSFNAIITPVDALSIDLSYYGYEKQEEARASRWNNSATLGNCGLDDRLLCGEFPEPEDTVVIEPRGFGRTSDADIYRAFINFDISEQWSTSYLFGRIEGETLAAITSESDPIGCGTVLPPFIILGGVSLCNFQSQPTGDVEYDSHELRFAFESDSFRTAFGVYYGDGQDSFSGVTNSIPAGGTEPVNVDRTVNTFFPGFPFDPIAFSNFLISDQETTTEVSAIFGEATLEISDSSRASVEARYTEEKITTLDLLADRTFDETFHFFTPRFTYEQDVGANSLLYGSVARGAKAGGFNTARNVSPEFFAFDPEFNWTYEVGSKNTLMGGRAIANVALFYTKWEDQQINSRDPNVEGVVPVVITRNLGDLTTVGFEFEGSLKATDNLSFDGSFSYVDATFDDGTQDLVFAAQCDDVVCGTDGDIGGKDMLGTPDTQLALGVQFDGAVSSADYSLRADVAYQSSFFSDVANLATIPSRTVVNATGTVNLTDELEIRVWARNLLDEKYVSNSMRIFQRAPNPNLFGALYGERRTVGVTVSYTFSK